MIYAIFGCYISLDKLSSVMEKLAHSLESYHDANLLRGLGLIARIKAMIMVSKLLGRTTALTLILNES